MTSQFIRRQVWRQSGRSGKVKLTGGTDCRLSASVRSDGFGFYLNARIANLKIFPRHELDLTPATPFQQQKKVALEHALG
jgi:hypothetical protein